jgi:hypothetical protein
MTSIAPEMSFRIKPSSTGPVDDVYCAQRTPVPECSQRDKLIALHANVVFFPRTHAVIVLPSQDVLVAGSQGSFTCREKHSPTFSTLEMSALVGFASQSRPAASQSTRTSRPSWQTTATPFSQRRLLPSQVTRVVHEAPFDVSEQVRPKTEQSRPTSLPWSHRTTRVCDGVQ